MSDFRGPENGALDPSLWEPETGPSYPTSARPQAGFSGEAEQAMREQIAGLARIEADIIEADKELAEARQLRGASVAASGAERVAAASGIPLLGGGTSAAGPEEPAPSAAAFSILAPDEYELLRRVEKLEALVREQETVIAMCVQVATRAAEKAGTGNGRAA